MSVKVRERDVESYLVFRLGELGLPCLKFCPDNKVGMPDRIVLLPNGRVLWVELKTDNGHLSAVQQYRHKQLVSLGHIVHTVWDKSQADDFVTKVQVLLSNNVTPEADGDSGASKIRELT